MESKSTRLHCGQKLPGSDCIGTKLSAFICSTLGSCAGRGTGGGDLGFFEVYFKTRCSALKLGKLVDVVPVMVVVMGGSELGGAAPFRLYTRLPESRDRDRPKLEEKTPRGVLGLLGRRASRLACEGSCSSMDVLCESLDMHPSELAHIFLGKVVRCSVPYASATFLVSPAPGLTSPKAFFSLS